jgi:hypothetical protein
MHKTTLATVLFLAALPAMTACSGAPDGSADPTASTTSAATSVPRATITGTAGVWSKRLLDDQIGGRLLPSVEIDLASPRRSYVLSDAVVFSSQESSDPSGQETKATFTLKFKSISVANTPAATSTTSIWVTVPGIGSFPVDSVQL